MGRGTGPTMTVLCFNPGNRLKEKSQDTALNHWQNTLRLTFTIAILRVYVETGFFFLSFFAQFSIDLAVEIRSFINVRSASQIKKKDIALSAWLRLSMWNITFSRKSPELNHYQMFISLWGSVPSSHPLLSSLLFSTMNPNSLPGFFLMLLSTMLGLSIGLEFTGSEGQWARYLRWDASTRSDMTFQFKTSEPEGLMLYFDDGGYCDFLLLAVSEGKLQLRVSIDCAETTITSDKMVNDSRWHFAAINRHNLRTGLALDGQTKTEEVRPQRQFMNIVSDLFLGGLPGDIRTSAITLPSVRELAPFKGIITDLSYGSKLPTLINSQKVRLEMMGLCTENPCENGGICSLADGEPYCDCSRTGYVGRYCTEGKRVGSRTFLCQARLLVKILK